MARPHALLRSGFPYYMTLGQRRVTSDPVDIGFGEENVYVLTRGGLGTEVRVINWEDENLGLRGVGNFTWPSSLLVDADENLYVSDEAKNTVTIMDKDGEVLKTWGETGSETGQLNRRRPWTSTWMATSSCRTRSTTGFRDSRATGSNSKPSTTATAPV